MWPETTTALLAPWQWAVLLLVPPAIVALYFLKLRRQPLEVPSTYLWRKSIEDLHVNSLWQRLRQSLLLFLQLLLVMLLLLALLRPSFMGKESLGDRLIFLVDVSASMSATDVQPTRLDEAKRKIGELIDAMDGGSAMLISFSDTARIEQGFTTSTRDLHRALAAIGPTNRPTDLVEALRVAAGRSFMVQLPSQEKAASKDGQPAGQMNSDQTIDAIPAKLFIVSDGKFADVQNFSLGSLEPVFLRVGKSNAANVGVVAFSTRRNEEKPEKLQAFARLENNGSDEAQVQVELEIDGRLRDTKQIKVPADGGKGVQFDIDDVESAVLHLRITPADAFALDNEAWAVINPHRLAKVLLVSPGNPLLERALNTSRAHELAEVTVIKPDVLEKPDQQKALAGGKLDLVIFDGCRPKAMPQANTLFVGRVPPGDAWTRGEKVPRPQIIDVDHAHPIMQLVDLSDVDIAEGFAVTGPPGSQRLIDSNKGTLLAIGPREGYEDAVLGFGLFADAEPGKDDADTLNTNWHLRISFPVFFHNLLEYMSTSRSVGSGGSTRPGTPLALAASGPTEKLRVLTPSGKPIDVTRGKLSTFLFSSTEQLGVYEVQDQGKTTQRFAVNLFDAAESDIRARADDAIQIGSAKVTSQKTTQPVRRDLWKWLAALALGVLLFEWYIYNRRVYL